MSKKKIKKKTTNTAKSRLSAQLNGQIVQDQITTVKSMPTVTPYPTAGRKVTEFEERLDAQLAGSKKPARGPGGKFSSTSPAAGPEIDISVIGQVVQIPFDLWSVSQGVPDLKISSEESVMLAKPVKQLLDHYVPQVPEITWAWISLSAVSYSIMKSRLALITEIKKQKPSSERGMDAARAANSSTKTQGHGGSHPSDVFPSLDQIQKPA